MEADMEIELENCQITSYQLGVLDADADRFDFSQLTTEPTAPAGEVNHSEFAIVKLLDAATPKTFDEIAVDPNNPNTDLLATPGPDDNVGLPAVQTGGIPVASGDVNGADMGGGGDDCDAFDFVAWQNADALGDPITFTYTVSNTSSAYEGTHVLYPDVVVPPGEGGVPKGDWIADVTYGSVEVLGQPTVATETLTIAHEGLLI
jgi:hypothetical protein